MRDIPKPGNLYKHFKGNFYRVIGIGVHSETKELMVIYKEEEESIIWVRPLDMFMSDVDHDKYPNIHQKYRFEKVNNNSQYDSEWKWPVNE